MSHKMANLLSDTFLYFAYGSNLLKKRIRINNPSAEFIGIGCLDASKMLARIKCEIRSLQMLFGYQGHQLNFIKESPNWNGAAATIIPAENFYVWGAIWRLHVNDMPALDKQEAVDTNWYFPKTVSVTSPDGSNFECRTYQQTVNPPPRKEGEQFPPDRRPSITYIDCMVRGAIECQLPEHYIQFLKEIPNNGNIATPKMIALLQECLCNENK